MTVSELVSRIGAEVLNMPAPDRTVTGGYTGDLLSWVMGRCREGDAWVTIMSSVNIVAVATLADPSCIIISENAELLPDTKEKAKEQGINLLRSNKDSFTLCAEIAALLRT